MVSGMHRKTYARISKKAIEHNLKIEQTRLGDDCELFAVVKADGYGHGAVEVAKIAKDTGVSGFCVALLDEALELRKAGITEPILILGIVDAEFAPIIAAENVSVTVSSLAWLKEAEKRMTQQKEPLRVHLAVDTGMGRIGFRTVSELKEVENDLNQSESVVFEGIFTHFATADEADETQFNKQLKIFNELVASLNNKPKFIHVANSATALWHQQVPTNLVRYGIAMYGLNPSGTTLSSAVSLEPAMELISELVHVKQIQAGDTVSYGATYEANKAEWVGTIPIGYADGWCRSLQGQTVLVDGNRCEIIGRICMDQCMIRLPREYPVGTQVVLVGKSGTDQVTMEELAEHLDTISYEIICGLTLRVPRIYV
ncbi:MULTISPECIES: alanine racemase [Carnobacterium]|uniref:alanine racemase n=1 Tax=Carnobacterium TaxID=2747 RepID=UPI0028923EB4|nr:MULTISPECIES: alanine racemase [Carnobacterium]MDT1940789.1 alanine racemase [Carnobacterium divergens]MDT1943228.1 alanine racemase [Carnobacterium divergens]MDT1949034.1 alanine racemase [Carnobacterium divergens]MDT1951518.1 alanine racemase [Carnobacterium divergens]MDT1956693.1 alanine racemase [Carnobacterium divergens]